jgi:hypothetical protein
MRMIKSGQMSWLGHEWREEATKNTKTWVDNIKMDLVQIGLSVVDWIGLAQDRDKWRAVLDAVMKLWVS